jgi:hypothetical protein
MASNFHNILGFLAVGLDRHIGLHVIPPLPIYPFIFWEIVAVHPFFMGPNQKPSVKINGVNSVVDCHTPILLWPHYPLIPDPLNALWPLDLIFGTQSCWLPRSTVLIEDTMSTCTIFECVSTNLDCNAPTKLPTDLTLQFATVKTTPSLADFLFGIARAVIMAAVDKAMDKLFGKVFDKLGSKLGNKFSNELGDKLGQKLAKTGLGSKLASKLGTGLSQGIRNQYGNRAGDMAAHYVGKKIMQKFLSKVGLQGSGLTKKALGQFGFDPSRLLPQIKPGAHQSWNPFSGWKGGTGALDKHIPAYGAGHGIIQALGG